MFMEGMVILLIMAVGVLGLDGVTLIMVVTIPIMDMDGVLLIMDMAMEAIMAEVIMAEVITEEDMVMRTIEGEEILLMAEEQLIVVIIDILVEEQGIPITEGPILQAEVALIQEVNLIDDQTITIQRDDLETHPIIEITQQAEIILRESPLTAIQDLALIQDPILTEVLAEALEAVAEATEVAVEDPVAVVVVDPVAVAVEDAVVVKKIIDKFY